MEFNIINEESKFKLGNILSVFKIPESEKEIVIARDGCRCTHVDPATGLQCTETAYSKLEMDHIKPWSKGGRTEVSNAQLLCKSHNTSKGARE